MIKAIIKKNPTFLYIKFDISGLGQLGLTSGWLRSQQPFIHPWLYHYCLLSSYPYLMNPH